MPLFLKIIGVKVSSKKPLPTLTPYIIVANHNSHLDTMALLSQIPAKDLLRTHPVAAATYFGRSNWLSILSNIFVNTLLIKRREEGGTSDALELISQYLEKRHSLIIFPEGSRGEPEKMQAFRKGIGVLLQKHPDIPYVPVYIQGTGKILPKGERLLVPYDAEVRIGEAIHAQSKEIDAILIEVQDAILALKDYK